MYRGFLIFIVVIFGSGLVQAQQSDSLLYPLSTINHRAGISFLELHDPYLSSLSYSGMGIRMEIAEQRFMRADRWPSTLLRHPKTECHLSASVPRFSTLLRLSGSAAKTMNPASTAAVNYIGGNLTWGMHYHYRKIENMTVLVGAAADGEFGMKQNTRNINNPVNMDIAFNINAMLGVRYFMQTKKRIIQFSGAYEMPLAGMMFVPYPGLSYYELYTSRRIGEALFFSSLHNRQGNKLAVSVDFPFRTTTLHAGWRFQHLKYQGSGPVFVRDEHALMLGITYDIFRSSGRRSRFPSNYIRSMY
jgi:hypothetical protein